MNIHTVKCHETLTPETGNREPQKDYHIGTINNELPGEGWLCFKGLNSDHDYNLTKCWQSNWIFISLPSFSFSFYIYFGVCGPSRLFNIFYRVSRLLTGYLREKKADHQYAGLNKRIQRIYVPRQDLF